MLRLAWRAIRFTTKAAAAAATTAAIVVVTELCIVAVSTPRLPHALKKDLTGRIESKDKSTNKSFQLLIFGDSVAGGVGCPSNDQAMAGSVARAISTQANVDVEYEVLGISGYTSLDMQMYLIPQLNKSTTEFDCCVISVGVNHVLSLHYPDTYALQLTNMLLALRKVLGKDCIIIVNAMPPMGKFPQISYLWPLCDMVTRYAKVMSEVTEKVCQETNTAICVDWDGDKDMFDSETIKTMMAADGFHPAVGGCDLIASSIAKTVWSCKENKTNMPFVPIDFDTALNRKPFYTVKHTFCEKECMPFWVADMELPTSPAIQKALEQRVEHPTFGYTIQPEEMWNRISTWLHYRHQWVVNSSEFIFTANLVSATVNCLHAYTEKKDAVAMLLPLYHPLQNCVTKSERKLVTIDMELKEDQYVLDISTMRNVFKTENVKLLIWCHPHNPGGRVWKRKELCEVVLLCRELNIILISDEIHSDLMLFGNKHIPMQLICDECKHVGIVTMSSPGKTFNIAGLHSGFVVIQNNDLRLKYMSICEPAYLHFGSVFATTAMMAAYTKEGTSYVKQLVSYLEENVRIVEQFCRTRIPNIKVLRPDASFLIFLNCSGLGLNGDNGLESELVQFFRTKAKVHLSDGFTFGGQKYAQFQRMNVGCSKSVLIEGLKRIEAAVLELDVSKEGRSV